MDKLRAGQRLRVVSVPSEGAARFLHAVGTLRNDPDQNGVAELVFEQTQDVEGNPVQLPGLQVDASMVELLDPEQAIAVVAAVTPSLPDYLLAQEVRAEIMRDAMGVTDRELLLVIIRHLGEARIALATLTQEVATLKQQDQQLTDAITQLSTDIDDYKSKAQEAITTLQNSDAATDPDVQAAITKIQALSSGLEQSASALSAAGAPAAGSAAASTTTGAASTDAAQGADSTAGDSSSQNSSAAS